MRLARLICFFLAVAFLNPALGCAKFGIIKTPVSFPVYHPPAFHSYGREIRVEVDSVDTRTHLMVAPMIRHLLEEGLTHRDFKVTPEARVGFDCFNAAG